jgi:hypothetical protein
MLSLALSRVSKASAMIGTLCLFGLSGCALAHGSPSPAKYSGASSPLATEMVYSAFPATAAQWADGARFSMTVRDLERAAWARCMTAHGFSQQAPVSAASIAGDVAMFQDNTQLPNLALMARTGLFVPATGFGSVGPSPASGPSGNKAVERAMTADGRKCYPAADRPMRSVTGALTALSNQWWGIIGQVEASAQVQAATRGFATCVQRHGVPVADAGSISAFLAWVTGLQTYSMGHSASVVIEHHWVGVFVPCARNLVAVREKMQLQRQRPFLQDHYQEILAAEDRVTTAMATLVQLAGAPPDVVAGK